MAFAISVGKPIRHNSFSKGEFVRYNGKELVDEEGTILPQEEFWASVQAALGRVDGKNIKMIKYDKRKTFRKG